MALPATDNFTASNGTTLTAYSSNWTIMKGGFTITSNAVYSTNATDDSIARWNADTFDADQYAQGTIASIPPSGNYDTTGIAARVQSSGANCYQFETDFEASFLGRNVAGTWTQIGSDGAAIAVSSVIRLEVEGTTLRPMVDGVLESTIGEQTDATFSSGAAGLCGYGNINSARLDNWEGGNLSTGTAHSGAGSTTMAFSETATGTRGQSGAGSTTMAFSGTGTLSGTTAHSGAGSAAMAFSGTAAGSRGQSGAGSTTMAFSGTGTLYQGVAHSGAGSTTMTFSGTGTLSSTTGHLGAGSTTMTFSGTASGMLGSGTPISFVVELDTLRDGSYGGTYDDITGYVTAMSWRNGMSDPYQTVAPPARATFTLKDPDGEWRQDWRGSEALSNGDFANWTSDNPDNWTVTGEVGGNPAVNEVGASRLHGASGTDYCNMFCTTGGTLSISQTALTVGQRYVMTLVIDTVDATRAGGLYIKNGSTIISKLYHKPGTKTLFFTATSTGFTIETYGAVDITLESVSVLAAQKYAGTLNKETLIRVQAQASSSAQTVMYIGQVVNSQPTLGEWGRREITITAECPTQRLLDMEYQPSLLLDATVDTVIDEVFDNAQMAYPYSNAHWTLDVEGLSILGVTTKLYGHDVTDFDTGNTTLPYAGDAENNTGKGTSAQGVIRSMMDAEMGRFFFDTRAGQFVLHNRMSDPHNTTTAASYTFGDFESIETASDDTQNMVTVTYEPREVGAAGETLWTAGGLPLTLEAGARREIAARYIDPDSDKPMGAMDFIYPVAGLDYIANTSDDGSGDDVTAQVTIAVEFGGSSAKVWLDSDVKCYVTTLQLRGTPLRRYDQQSVTVVNGDSIYDNGKQETAPVMIPAISDPDYAEGVARLLLARYSDKLLRLSKVGFVMGYEATTDATQAIARSIGDRIAISDTWSGHDQDYVIVGEEHTVTGGEAGFWRGRWVLRPLARETYWQLDVSGYSELGVSTRLSL